MAFEKTVWTCVIILAVFSPQVEATKCSSGNVCPGSQHCCRRNNICRDNCVGEPCSFHSNCAPGEYCCDGKCALNCSSCYYNSNCKTGEKCCGPSSEEGTNSKCSISCLGKLCSRYSQCNYLQSCCAGVCKYGCSTCSKDSECSSGEVCCGLHLHDRGDCAKSCVNTCEYDSHCPSGEFCCGGIRFQLGICASSCIGKTCKYDGHCGAGEYCCGDGICAASCIGKSCSSTFINKCGPGAFCCDLGERSVGSCAASCIGKSCSRAFWYRSCAPGEYCSRDKKCSTNCSSDSDCTFGDEVCCDRITGRGRCAKWCLGKSCKYKSHCASGEYCCLSSGTCSLICTDKVCISDSDCPSSESCCGIDHAQSICSKSCIGTSCRYDSHCASREHCCGPNRTCASRTCDKSEYCFHHGYCAHGESCCGIHGSSDIVCAKSCIGKSCKKHSHCASGEYCCSNDKCALNCIGKPCSQSAHCAWDEVCSFNEGFCVRKPCTYDYQCLFGESCCDVARGVATCSRSCLEKSCEKDQHCALGERCCGFKNRRCARTCIGEPCNSDGDCSTGQCCKDKKCKQGDCYYENEDEETLTNNDGGNAWRIAVGIVVPLVLIIPSLCMYCVYRKTKSQDRRVHRNREIQRAARRRTLEEQEERERQQQRRVELPLNVQNLQPYPNQPPPLYSTQPPPPHSTRPPLPNTNEPPPPYSAVISRDTTSPPSYHRLTPATNVRPHVMFRDRDITNP